MNALSNSTSLGKRSASPSLKLLLRPKNDASVLARLESPPPSGTRGWRILMDLADESMTEIPLPALHYRDQQLLTQRRLEQAFGPTPLTCIGPEAIDLPDRSTDAKTTSPAQNTKHAQFAIRPFSTLLYRLGATTAPPRTVIAHGQPGWETVAAPLKALQEHAIEGIWSPALLAPHLLEQHATHTFHSPHPCLICTYHTVGIRQTLVLHGQARQTRFSCFPSQFDLLGETHRQAWTVETIAQSLKFMLAGASAATDHAPPSERIVLAGRGWSDIVPALPTSLLVPVGNILTIAPDIEADRLFLDLLDQADPACQFAPSKWLTRWRHQQRDRRFFQISASLLALAALYVLALTPDWLQRKQAMDARNHQAHQLEHEHNQALKAVSTLNQYPPLLAALKAWQEGLDQQAKTVDLRPLLTRIANSLDRHPEFELQTLELDNQSAPPPQATAASPASLAHPGSPPRSSFAPAEHWGQRMRLHLHLPPISAGTAPSMPPSSPETSSENRHFHSLRTSPKQTFHQIERFVAELEANGLQVELEQSPYLLPSPRNAPAESAIHYPPDRSQPREVTLVVQRVEDTASLESTLVPASVPKNL